MAVIWHEGVAGRNDEDIASSWVKAIGYLEDMIGSGRKITLWADNCSAQNKCWTMFTTLCWLVNRDDVQVDQITIKYLEPGHTYMSAELQAEKY